MGKRTVAVLIMWVVVVAAAAVVVEVCWCWGEETRQSNTAETMILTEDAEEDKADSWADWAVGKASQRHGFNQNDAKGSAQRVMDKVGDVASKTTETMNSAASALLHIDLLCRTTTDKVKFRSSHQPRPAQ